MPKYKKVNEGVIDKFLDKIFNSAAKNMQSSALKKLSKADPEFKKNYEELLKARDKMEKNLKAKGLTSAEVAASYVAKRMRARRRGEQVEEKQEQSPADKYAAKNKLKYKDDKGKDKEVSLKSALKKTKDGKNHAAYKQAKSILDKFSEKEKADKSKKKANFASDYIKSKDDEEKKKAKEKETKKKKKKDKKQKIAKKFQDKEDAESEKGLDALGKFFGRPK